MSALDWPVDADGYPHREAARVLLFDATDVSCWPWGTTRISPSVPGGSRSVVASRRGRIPGAAAVREVFEETGIRLETSDLVGPVLYRTAEFDFLAVTARQDEWFFIAHLPLQPLSVGMGGLSWNVPSLTRNAGGISTRPRQPSTEKSTPRRSSSLRASGKTAGTASSSS